MNRIGIIFLALVLHGQTLCAQETKRKNIFPIWTFHQREINIHGLSLGLASWQGEPRLTNTNGIKIELIGLGVFSLLMPSSPVSTNEAEYNGEMSFPVSEKINGVNLSASGTICNCRTSGLIAGFVGQFNTKVNGLSAAGYLNMAEAHNGVQLAFLYSESYQMRGLQMALFALAHRAQGVQIGLYNWAKQLKGIQIGLWHKNQKRSLPIINWSFKD